MAFAGRLAGRREVGPAGAGEGNFAKRNRRSAAEAPLFWRGLPEQDGWDDGQGLIAARFRRGLPATWREAQFERSGDGRSRVQRTQAGLDRRNAGGGAKPNGPATQAEHSAALRWGATRQRAEEGRTGAPRLDSQRSSADAPLNKGTRRKAQTRGRGQGKDHNQGKGRAAERPAPNTAAGATT